MQSLRTGTSVSGTWHAPQKLKGKTVRSAWTANTINPMLARMRAIIADLVAQGVLTRNPASLAKALHPVKPMSKTLEAEQIPALLRATDNHPFGIAWAAGVVGTTPWRNPRIDVGLRRFPKERATYLSGAHSHTGRLPRRTDQDGQ